jgi:hypothetical protein
MTEEAEKLHEKLNRFDHNAPILVFHGLTIDEVMIVLYEKISEKHNLRENCSCEICNHYFQLRDKLFLRNE